MPSPKNKKELQSLLGIINYLGKLSPRMVEVCEAQRKLTSAKAEWIWNARHQKLFKEAKASVIEDGCIKFHVKGFMIDVLLVQ